MKVLLWLSGMIAGVLVIGNFTGVLVFKEKPVYTFIHTTKSYGMINSKYYLVVNDKVIIVNDEKLNNRNSCKPVLLELVYRNTKHTTKVVCDMDLPDMKLTNPIGL